MLKTILFLRRLNDLMNLPSELLSQVLSNANSRYLCLGKLKPKLYLSIIRMLLVIKNTLLDKNLRAKLLNI